MILSTAFFIATLACSGLFPLVQTMPAEVKAIAFILCAYTADDSLVLCVDTFTEALTARTLLNPQRLLQVVFGNFCLKCLLFIFSEDGKPTHFNVAPFFVTANFGVVRINVRTEKDELSSREQALAVGSERLRSNGMTTWHLGSLPLGVVIPRDHIRFISQLN